MRPIHREHIVCRAAFREAAVAVHPHVVDRLVHVVLVRHEHLAEVVRLSRLPEDFSLEESRCRIVPAGAAAVLVLHWRDRVLLHGGKHERVLFLLRLSLFRTPGLSRRSAQHRQDDQHCLSVIHLFLFFTPQR